MSKVSVIVIGAGVAGLTTAKELLAKYKEYFDVIVLEGSNQIGGRVNPKKFGNYIIENGAQWVHGEKGNLVYERFEHTGYLDNNTNNLKFNDDALFVTEDGCALDRDTHSKVGKIIGALIDGPPDPADDASYKNKPLAAWTEAAYWRSVSELNLHEDKKVCKAIMDWIHRLQNNMDGADSWFETSADGQSEYLNCPGNMTVSWMRPSSYAVLLNSIIQGEISTSLDIKIPSWIKLDSAVKKIKLQNDGKVKVECSDEKTLTCDHVVFTGSLGVLKCSHKDLFIPELPEYKRLAIEHIGFGTVNKVHLEFSKRWWPQLFVGYNLLWTKSTDCFDDIVKSNVSSEFLNEIFEGFPRWCRGILGFYSVQSHPCTLNSWVTGAVARHIETLSEEFLCETFMKILKKVVGKEASVPNPTRFAVSTWHKNPFTRGSYSFRSVSSEVHGVKASDLASPICDPFGVPRILFAGEATHNHYYSTVHGAMETGLREAKRLVDVVESRKN